MNTLKALICASLVGAGTIVAVPEQADAGSRFSFSIGVGRPYYGGYGWYGGGYPDHHGAYYGGHGHGHRVWHDTSHWDYHPGTYVRHYDHYHYIPGHYHWHNDGHWDYYHHWH